MNILNPLIGNHVQTFFKGKSVKLGKGIRTMEREEVVLQDNFPIDALYIPSRGFTGLRIETMYGELIFRPLLSPMLDELLNRQFKYDYGIPMYAIIGNTMYVYVIDNLTIFGDAVHIYQNVVEKCEIDHIIELITKAHMPWIYETNVHNHIKHQVLEVIRVANKKLRS